MRKFLTLPNILTASRILLSAVLVCLHPQSVPFLAVYLLCGVTDMLDGPLARRTRTASRAGEVLDSIADAVFLAAAAIRLYPFISLPSWVWLWALAVAAVKLAGIVIGFVRRGTLCMPHTAANRLTGGLLFLWGSVLGWVDSPLPAVILCVTASCAAVQELYLLSAPGQS